MTAFVVDHAGQVVVAAGSTLTHVFNAPFHLGFTLDTHGLIHRRLEAPSPAGLARYEVHQEAVLRRLDDTWRRPGVAEGGRQQFDVDTYAGSPFPPLYFLQRKLTDLPALNAGQVDNLLTLTVEGVDLKVFDFGVGTITIGVTVVATTDLRLAELRSALEHRAQGGQFDSWVQPTIAESLGQLYAAVPRDWMAPAIGPYGELAAPHAGDGAPLWTHRIHHIPVAPTVELEDVRKATWTDLLPPVPASDLHPVRSDGMLFVPQNGASIAYFRPGGDPVTLVHAIELQNAYWAGAARFDRALLQRVAALSYDTRACGYAELEARTSEIIGFYERVRMFRMVLGSLRGSFAPLQRATWDALARAWCLDPLLDAVDDKLDGLTSIHQQLLGDAEHRKSRRLNTGVFVVTAFSLAQTLFAGIAFGFTTNGGNLTGTRVAAMAITIAVIAACALVAVMLLLPGRRSARRSRRRVRGTPGETPY